MINSTVPLTPAWSANDVSLQYKVYLGLWTNWSRGSVLGQTLTLTRQQGNLLIAITGFYISYIGTRLWRIICLALHRSYSTPRQQEALYHQRQIILRNNSSADSTIADLFQLHIAWRQGLRFTWLLPTFFLGLLYIIAFIIAGGFSSQISSSTSTEVLLDGSKCALINFYDDTSDNQALLAWSYDVIQVSNSFNYVKQCYSINSFYPIDDNYGSIDASGLFDCRSFVKERLPTFIDHAAPCPFKNNICQNNSSNLRLDTGYLDSHNDFGLNAPKNERILFRRILECAPLLTAGRFVEVPDETYGSFIEYNYSDPSDSRNYTYSARSLASQYPNNDSEWYPGDYLVETLSALTVNGVFSSGDFKPESDLMRADADIYLIFLSGNGVLFKYPINDSWYQATSPSIRSAYSFDVAAAPLACAEQFQFCRDTDSSCGPMASSSDAITGAHGLFGILDDNYDIPYNISNPDDTSDAGRFRWFSNLIYNSDSYIDGVTDALGASALVSAITLSQGTQTAQLLINQWQIDLTYIWATVLAMQQSIFVESAHGSSVMLPKVLPNNTAQRAMCNNQKIQTTDYTSFNFFALLFTYIVGIIIVIVSFSLDPLLALLQRYHGFQAYAELEWRTNAALQLHRLAHEEADMQQDTWRNCSNTVPTTRPGILLAALEIVDPDHPRLQTTSVASQSSTNMTLHSSRSFDTPTTVSDEFEHAHLTSNNNFPIPTSRSIAPTETNAPIWRRNSF